jgi:hypothetical protein
LQQLHQQELINPRPKDILKGQDISDQAWAEEEGAARGVQYEFVAAGSALVTSRHSLLFLS